MKICLQLFYPITSSRLSLQRCCQRCHVNVSLLPRVFWTLRIRNVIAHALYIVYCYRYLWPAYLNELGVAHLLPPLVLEVGVHQSSWSGVDVSKWRPFVVPRQRLRWGTECCSWGSCSEIRKDHHQAIYMYIHVYVHVYIVQCAYTYMYTYIHVHTHYMQYDTYMYNMYMYMYYTMTCLLSNRRGRELWRSCDHTLPIAIKVQFLLQLLLSLAYLCLRSVHTLGRLGLLLPSSPDDHGGRLLTHQVPEDQSGVATELTKVFKP